MKRSPISYLIMGSMDPLRRNALLLLANSLLIAFIGFIFWLVAARLYSVSDVGSATAIVSTINLLASISSLGLGVGIVRFLADEKDKSTMINSCFIVVGLVSTVTAIIFIAGLKLWSPALIFMQQNYLIAGAFVIFTCASTLFMQQYFVYISLRAAQFSLIQSVITLFRIVLLALVGTWGIVGIFFSHGIAYLIAFIIGTFFLSKALPVFKATAILRTKMINNMLAFSFINHIGDLFRLMPGMVLPIIILNIAGSEMSAYFYIGWSMASLLFNIPFSVTGSLLAEASNNPENLRNDVFKSIRFIFILLLPTIFLFIAFGYHLLHLFGAQYAQESLYFLWILVLSSIPMAFNELYVIISRIDKKNGPVVYTRGFIALTTVIGSYFLLPIWGLVTASILWIVSNTIISTIAVPLIFKRVRLSPTRN